MKKLIVFVVLLGLTFTYSFSFAANLSQAVSTLPQNEEWALMAYASIGQNVGSTYLKSNLSGGSATDYEKRILAITAQGQNPRTWGTENFVASLLSKFDGSQIGSSSLINDDIFGLLALRSAGESGNVTDKLRSHILSRQNSDGGWSFTAGGSSDSNTTAMAVAALKTNGSVPSSAINYLKNSQQPSGGYGFTPNTDADGASTAWVIIGLRSAGEAVPSSATAFLDSLQTSAGSFKWKPGEANGSQLVTSYAVIALAGKTMPIRTISNNPTPPPPAPQPNPNPSPNPPSPNPSPSPNPTPAPSPFNNSTCLSLIAPNQVQIGQNFTANVTIQNTGTKNWTTDTSPHRLGSQSPQDNTIWGIARVNLPFQLVTANQSVTFTINAKAPTTTGTYSFAWRMVEENVQWFGDTCSKTIQVASPAPNPTPIPPPPAPLPVPPPPTPQPAPVPPPPPGQISNIVVMISYPGNKIYVENLSFSTNPTALQALVVAAEDINLLYDIKQTSFGPFVNIINGYAPSGSSGWLYAINGNLPNMPASEYVLKPGDKLQWFYGGPSTQPY